MGLKGKGRGRKRRPKHPIQLEREYRKILTRYVEEYKLLVHQLLIEKLPSLVLQAKQFRPDGYKHESIKEIKSDGWVENIAEIIKAITILFPQRTSGITRSIESIAKKVNDFNDQDVRAVIRSAMGADVFIRQPWLEDQLKAFIAENKDYVIKSLPTAATAQIQGIALRGLRAGYTAQKIGAEIQDQFGITKRRAELIARDQVSKLNNQLTMLRHKELGVKQFVWRTAMDNRVRPEHEELEGETFDYDDLPSEGLPGDACNCRCTQEPIIEGFE